MKNKKDEKNKRSTVFELSVDDLELRKKIVASIRGYRAVVRKIYSAYAMAEMAGADIRCENGEMAVNPDSEKTKDILKQAFGKPGKAHMYEMRSWVKDELMPTWMSFVWDSARIAASKVWVSKDPDITKASRGWLVLQGAREMAFFNRIGIGFPVDTAHPDLHDHYLTLKWDHEIGKVNFKIGRLDGGRYLAWKNIRDREPGWELGTIYLNERQNKNGHKILAIITHTRPFKNEVLDKAKVLNVEFTNDPANFITLSTESNKLMADKISAEEAFGWLESLRVQQQKYYSQKAATGNPHKKWGSPRIYESVVHKLNNLTLTRKNGEQTRNHLWTRRIIEHAIRSNCGTIHVLNMPKEALLQHPWGWHQFSNFLEYKAKEIGATVVL